MQNKTRQHRSRLTKVTKWLIRSTYTAAVLAVIMAVYRIVAFVVLSEETDIFQGINYVAKIASLISIGAWMIVYGDYVCAKYGIIHYRKFVYMEEISAIAGIFCVLRLLTTLLYFMQIDSSNLVTTIYVCCELLLWFVLTVFFFMFMFDRKHTVGRH